LGQFGEKIAGAAKPGESQGVDAGFWEKRAGAISRLARIVEHEPVTGWSGRHFGEIIVLKSAWVAEKILPGQRLSA